jgi:hypothetical protein
MTTARNETLPASDQRRTLAALRGQFLTIILVSDILVEWGDEVSDGWLGSRVMPSPGAWMI